jgi:hypothetical protein
MCKKENATHKPIHASFQCMQCVLPSHNDYNNETNMTYEHL